MSARIVVLLDFLVMKALVITSLTGIDGLKVQDAPPLTAKPGQTIVKVAAGGMNFADLMTTKGGYPGTPPPQQL